MGYCYNYILVGYPLASLAADSKAYSIESRQFGLSSSLQAQFSIILQTVLNLQGKSAIEGTLLKGDAMDQEKLLRDAVEGKGQSMTLRDISIYRLMLACIFRRHDVQKEMLEVLSSYNAFNPSIARMHLWQVFAGFAAFQIHHRTNNNKYNIIGSKSLEYFKQSVSQGSLNAYPMLLFLQAAKSPSKSAFDEAIRVCSRSGLVNFQAMMNESAALYFLEQNDEELATYYMKRAVGLYEDWGATGKVNELLNGHKHLLGWNSMCSTRSPSQSSIRHRNYRESITASIKKVEFDAEDLDSSSIMNLSTERAANTHSQNLQEFYPIHENCTDEVNSETEKTSISHESDPRIGMITNA